jgi:hypothetical protein
VIPALVGSGLARLATELGALTPQLLVNATPLGMAGGAEEDRLPVPSAAVESADTVFDVVAFPSRTPLGRTADPPPRKTPGAVSVRKSEPSGGGARRGSSGCAGDG